MDVAASQAVNDLYSQGLQIEQALRTTILDPQNKNAGENLQAAASQFKANVEKLQQLGKQDPTNQALADTITPLQAKLATIQNQVKALAQTNQAEAIALLGPDGAHLQDLSLALRRELEAIVYLGPLRQRPARDQVWNKGGSGSVGAEGQQAINALLSDALQPGAGQGAVLRSVSADETSYVLVLSLIHISEPTRPY